MSHLVGFVAALLGFGLVLKASTSRGASIVSRLILALIGTGLFWGATRGGLMLIWPILSGWQWLFGASLTVFVQRSLSPFRDKSRVPVGALFAVVFFAVPSWITRDQTSLLTGSIPLGPMGGLPLLVVSVLIAFAWTALTSWTLGSRVAKGVVVYSLLIGGSIVFSIPFFWLLLTSLKEERDMTNAAGLVWIPRVTQTRQALDPVSPLYETQEGGTAVQVEKRGVEPGGVRVSVVRPASLAGSSIVVPATSLREVPRTMKLVNATVDGDSVEALLLDEDGKGAHLQITQPENRKGQLVTVSTEQVEPIRRIGLLWKNYPDALESLPSEAEGGLGYLRNTLFLCLMSVVGTLVSCTVVAYGFARLRFPGRDFLFGVLLATMMLPGAVTMLPSFLIFRQLGWVDSLTPIWAPAFFGSAFNIFLLRQFFLTLPQELEDAAKIDGCGYLQTLVRVMAPLIKPALVVVSIWTFIGAWNNFMGPLIYVNSTEKMTIAYAMQLFSGDKVNQPGLLMAFATMALAPVVLLFFFAQRAFVEGIALTGRTG